ncbi:MAG: hypothetical protein ACXU9J_09275 [Syntrophales bacterium]
MNYFEDWYTEPIDNEEANQEKRLALMLQAAADVPTAEMDHEPQEDSSSASNHASFNPRTGTDLIQQIVNRNVADINLGLGDTKDLPGASDAVADFFRNATEAVDDLDFFDRKAMAIPFSDLAGSTGLDDDFWERLGKGSGQEAQIPSADGGFNFALKTGEAANAANLWNNPAEAGKNTGSDKPDAYLRFEKKLAEEHFPGVDFATPPGYPLLKKFDEIKAWYDKLPLKPTGGSFEWKLVPTGTPGSEKGQQIGNTGLVAVPTKVDVKIEVPFHTDEVIEKLRKGIQKLFGK